MMEKILSSPVSEEFPKDMYEIPGHNPILEKDLFRYQKDKEQDKAIKKLAHLFNIKQAPKEERPLLIKQALENVNPKIQLKGAEVIDWGELSDKQEELTKIVSQKARQALESNKIDNQIIGTEMIRYASLEDRAPLIIKALESNEPQVQVEGADKIVWAPKEEYSLLVKQALRSERIEVQIAGAGATDLAPVKEREELKQIVYKKIKEALDSDEIEVQLKWAKMIHLAPQENQKELGEIVCDMVNQALEKASPKIQLELAEMIRYIPKEEIAPLIKKSLKNNDPRIQLKWATKIVWAAPEDKPALIKQALENGKLESQLNGDIRYWYISEKEAYKLAKQALGSDDPQIQTEGIEMIQLASEDKKEELREMVRSNKQLFNYLITPPLYRKNPEINNEQFSRRKFEKTGSETTLIGGALKDKLIIRHINPEAFIAWQKLYEDYETWQKAGFDYVPIEPIQSYRLNKDGLVDVYSGVLDLSLVKYFVFCPPKDLEKIDSYYGKILEVVSKQGIRHGHPESHNICLRFFRDKNGEPDLTKIPRLYLIDFDEAVFTTPIKDGLNN